MAFTEAAFLKLLPALAMFGVKAHKDFSALKPEDYGGLGKSILEAVTAEKASPKDYNAFMADVAGAVHESVGQLNFHGRTPADVERDRTHALTQFFETLPNVTITPEMFVDANLDSNRIATLLTGRLAGINPLFETSTLSRQIAHTIFERAFGRAAHHKEFCERLVLPFQRGVLYRLEAIKNGQSGDRATNALRHEELLAAIARDKGVDPKFLRVLFEKAEMDPTIPDGQEERYIRQAVDILVAQGAEKLSPSNIGPEIDAALALARSKMRQLDSEGALKVLRDRRAIERDERLHRQRGEARLLDEEALVLKATFRVDEAIIALEQATALDPDDAWRWFDLGDLCRTHRSLASAISAYDHGGKAASRAGNERNLSVSHEKIGNVRSA